MQNKKDFFVLAVSDSDSDPHVSSTKGSQGDEIATVRFQGAEDERLGTIHVHENGKIDLTEKGKKGQQKNIK